MAVFHWAYPPVVGGVETHLASLLPALAARGHRISLFTGTARGAPLSEPDRGVLIRRSPLWLPRPDLPAGRLEEAARAALAEAKPDLLHLHNLHYFSPRHQDAWLMAAEREGIPTVFTAHNVWHDELGTQMAAPLAKASAVIAVSAYLAAELVLQGVPASRIRVIHHGTPLAGSPYRPPPHGAFTLFHPARLSLDKGSLDVVEAFAQLAQRHPHLRLRLAGTGPIVDFAGRQASDVRLVHERIRELGLKGRVTISALSWQEMPRALAESHVVVYPSRFEEPFGLAALEGMAVGRPVVVSSMGGLPEFVVDGEVGHVVPPADTSALAAAVARLIKEPGLARRMGRAGHARVAERHSLTAMVSATEALFQDVVGQTPNPPTSRLRKMPQLVQGRKVAIPTGAKGSG